MKRQLILCALAASAVCSAAVEPARQQAISVGHPVSQRALKMPASAPRHLSDQERAQLRRQLEQFNRQQHARHP